MNEPLKMSMFQSTRGISTSVPCPACEEENSPRSRICQLCHYSLDGGKAAEPICFDPKIKEAAPDGYIRTNRLVRELEPFGEIRSFLGVQLAEGGRRTPVIVRVRPVNSKHISTNGIDLIRPTFNTAADTVRMAAGPYSGGDPMHMHYEILSHATHAALPSVIDYFEEHGQAVLVESAALGTPLLNVWNMFGVTPTLRMAWLEEIWSALVELHRRDVIFPTLTPSRIVVSPDGRARIRDAFGVYRLPFMGSASHWNSPAIAPELVRTPLKAGLQADAYHFGAFVWATFLGRELHANDFLEFGVPKPFVESFPDAVPPLVRLVRKCVNVDLQARFPTNIRRAADPSGFTDIREALQEYSRASEGIRFDIAGWSTTGILRDNNEDCFKVMNHCSGAADFRYDLAAICLADGMGGLDKGEVAAAAAVTAVVEYLRANGLTATAMDQFGAEQAMTDVPKIAAIVEKAVHEANRQVFELSNSTAGCAGMGSTLEVVVCSARNVVIYHIGDSRVYHKSGANIRQITVDQTFVNKLLERGEITEEEAENHPYRAAVVQAVGAQATLEPAFYQLQIQPGDWLVACSDGISNHIQAHEMNVILANCVNAEQASRRLVNLANTRGGFDNATAVVVAAR